MVANPALLRTARCGRLFFSHFTYVPTYTSTTTFVVSNRPNSGYQRADSLTSSDLSASTTLANTFKYILLSELVLRNREIGSPSTETRSKIRIRPLVKSTGAYGRKQA